MKSLGESKVLWRWRIVLGLFTRAQGHSETVVILYHFYSRIEI